MLFHYLQVIQQKLILLLLVVNIQIECTLNILLSSSISDFPGHRGFIVRNSANIQPTLHRSIGVEYSCKMKVHILVTINGHVIIYLQYNSRYTGNELQITCQHIPISTIHYNSISNTNTNFSSYVQKYTIGTCSSLVLLINA